jgi:hypothetical protein
VTTASLAVCLETFDLLGGSNSDHPDRKRATAWMCRTYGLTRASRRDDRTGFLAHRAESRSERMSRVTGSVISTPQHGSRAFRELEHTCYTDALTTTSCSCTSAATFFEIGQIDVVILCPRSARKRQLDQQLPVVGRRTGRYPPLRCKHRRSKEQSPECFSRHDRRACSEDVRARRQFAGMAGSDCEGASFELPPHRTDPRKARRHRPHNDRFGRLRRRL